MTSMIYIYIYDDKKYLYLHLITSTRITPKGLKQLAKGCHQLRVLQLRNAKGIDDNCMASIAGFTELRFLDVSWSSIRLRHHQYSWYRPVFWHFSFSDAGFVLVISRTTKLSTLQCRGCSKLTSKSARALQKYCLRIHTLDMDRCPRIKFVSIVPLMDVLHSHMLRIRSSHFQKNKWQFFYHLQVQGLRIYRPNDTLLASLERRKLNYRM